MSFKQVVRNPKVDAKVKIRGSVVLGSRVVFQVVAPRNSSALLTKNNLTIRGKDKIYIDKEEEKYNS